MNRTTSVPKSVCHCKLDKESNFFSGILCFLVNFQDFPNKSLTNELNNHCCFIMIYQETGDINTGSEISEYWTENVQCGSLGHFRSFDW